MYSHGEIERATIGTDKYLLKNTHSIQAELRRAQYRDRKKTHAHNGGAREENK